MVSKIKKYIPLQFKYLGWYIFKSPQRRLGFLRSISQEINALFAFLSHIGFSNYKNNLKPISICTGIKDRTSNYLDFVLSSILEMDHQDLIEISIFDCGSKDVSLLKEELGKKWRGKMIFSNEIHDFTRSFSFNRAIDQSSNELFFVSDADMTLPKDLVEQCNKYVTQKTVWFPICFSLYENKHPVISSENGEWRITGKGMFASTKKQFEKAGKFNLQYKTWGWEDIDIWISYFNAGIMPLRKRCNGLIHNWHPSLEVETEIPQHLEKFGI